MKDQDRIVIYARGHRAPDVHTRIYVPIFTQPELAAAWMNFFIDGEAYRREDDKLLLDSGMSLTCAQLDRVLAAEPGEVNAVDERRILRFKHGTWDEVHTKPTAAVERAPKVEREARPDRPVEFVTITDLCAGSGVLPMHARAALRASGREKPAYGWAFDPKEVPAIKELCGIK